MGEQVPVALVTGASSGIGDQFARQLAAKGYDLVVVARDRSRLDTLAGELRSRHGTSTEVLAADLVDPTQLATVEDRLRDGTRPVELLVNNAGFGTYGRFWENDLETEVREVLLNVVALQRLTHAALGGMVPRGRGGLINVASIAAYQPTPAIATYGASKSFVYNFTQAVHEDLNGTGVKAMALCPGFVHTAFQERAGVNERGVPGPLWMSAEDCARVALGDYERGRAVSVPGVLNTVGAVAISLTPRVVTRKVARMVMRRGNP